MLEKFKKIQKPLFLLGVCSLPIYQTLNHWFLGAFLAVSTIIITLDKKNRKLLIANKYFLLAVASFFLIQALGIFRAINIDYGVKEAIKALPFLLYPIAILSVYDTKLDIKKFQIHLFYSLTIGCLITAIICWGNVLINLNPNDIPANQIFGWKRSGIFLTKILDLHPPYLGLLLVASLLFLLQQVFTNKQMPKWLLIVHILVICLLFIFLFNITARNALFYFLLVIISYLLYHKKWKLLLIPLFGIIIINVLIINHPSKYYRIKMYDMLGLTDKEEIKDKRFSRLTASYNVFKTSPIIGVGLGYDNELRTEQYKQLNYKTAYKDRHNSHNQLFEYLVSSGLIGGLLFFGVNLFFIIFLIREKQYFYLVLLFGVLFSTITESTFERVLGIQYYSIIIGMALLVKTSNKENSINLNK